MNNATPQRLFWSTDMVRPEDRLRLWRETYARTFIETDIESMDGESFSGSLRYERCGAIGIGIIGAKRERYTVSAGQARRNPEGFILDLVQAGQCYYRQGGFDLPVGQGGGMFLHNQMPSQMWSAGPSETFSLSLPAAAIERRIGDAGRLVGRTLPSGIPETKLLLAYMRAMFGSAETMAADTRNLVASHCADLIVAAVGHDWRRAVEAGEVGVRAARYQLARNEVARRFAEPLLNGQRIATALGLSERYLQRLFEEHGQTISELIMATRLDAVRRSLGAAASRHLSTAGIATACGFSDISSFNRSFRRAYGETPTAVRARSG